MLNAILKPKLIAKAIIRVAPKTEAAPLIANPQSINSPTLSAPFGNGIPMKNPSGAIKREVIAILGNMGKKERALVKFLNNNISNINSPSISRKTNLSLKILAKRLPIPELMSSVSKIVEML